MNAIIKENVTLLSTSLDPRAFNTTTEVELFLHFVQEIILMTCHCFLENLLREGVDHSGDHNSDNGEHEIDHRLKTGRHGNHKT
jgi:hypothetical protein